MKRKLVQMGKNCLMSTIPMKWIKQQNLKKGDYIEIEEVENYLLISAKGIPSEKEISINIKEDNRVAIMRTLQLIYDAGFKNVKIKYSNEKVLSNISWTINFLDSWRIKEVSKNSCEIESIFQEDFDFENYFRRIFLKTKELPKLFSEYLSGNKKSLEEIKVEYDLIIKGTMEIKRRINTSSLPLEYKYYYFIAIQLEEIADHYEYFLRNLEIEKIDIEIKDINQELATLLEKIYLLFYNFKLDGFFEFQKELNWKKFESKNLPLLIYHLRAISERIRNISKYMIGIRLK